VLDCIIQPHLLHSLPQMSMYLPVAWIHLTTHCLFSSSHSFPSCWTSPHFPSWILQYWWDRTPSEAKTLSVCMHVARLNNQHELQWHGLDCPADEWIANNSGQTCLSCWVGCLLHCYRPSPTSTDMTWHAKVA